MEPTSPRQFAAEREGGVPDLERVRDDVWALGQPMPGERLGYSLLYLLRDEGGMVHVVDPGTDTDANWTRLTAALSSLDASPADIATITATHLHFDHLGMAGRLREASGAVLQVHEAEARALAGHADRRPSRDEVGAALRRWQVPEGRVPAVLAMADGPPAETPATPTVDRTLVHGQRLDVPGFALRAVHTPGHTPGSLTLHDADRGLAFTGDTVLPQLVAGLGLGGPTATNALADYLSSVDLVVELGDVEALPGHGWRFTGLQDRARASADHHLRRTREVEALDPALSTWETASRLTWTDGFAALDGFTLWSALTQTDMHREYVTARRPRG